MKKKCFELKTGDKMVYFGSKWIIRKIEFSGTGVKQGKAKCRLELENEVTKDKKILIKLSDEIVETI